MINHPVHIQDTKGQFSRSSFIPFCSFGEDLSLVGSVVQYFDFPVCRIFKPIIRNDQLCFESDLEQYKDYNNLLLQLKMGLTLILDYNEDKQLNVFDEDLNMNETTRKQLFNFQRDEQSAQIFLDTISNIN